MFLKICLIGAILVGIGTLVITHTMVAPAITGLKSNLAEKETQLSASQEAESKAKKEAAAAKPEKKKAAAKAKKETKKGKAEKSEEVETPVAESVPKEVADVTPTDTVQAEEAKIEAEVAGAKEAESQTTAEKHETKPADEKQQDINEELERQ